MRHSVSVAEGPALAPEQPPLSEFFPSSTDRRARYSTVRPTKRGEIMSEPRLNQGPANSLIQFLPSLDQVWKELKGLSEAVNRWEPVSNPAWGSLSQSVEPKGRNCLSVSNFSNNSPLASSTTRIQRSAFPRWAGCNFSQSGSVATRQDHSPILFYDEVRGFSSTALSGGEEDNSNIKERTPDFGDARTARGELEDTHRALGLLPYSLTPRGCSTPNLNTSFVGGKSIKKFALAIPSNSTTYETFDTSMVVLWPG